MVRRSRAAWVLLWAVLALCQQHSSAKTEVQLSMDVGGLIKLADGLKFTYEATGLNLTLSGIKLFRFHGRDEETNYERFGLLLVPAEGEAQSRQRQYAAGHCVLEDVNSLFTFRDALIQRVINGETEEATFQFRVAVEGTYGVYFANCAAPTFAVSLAVRLDSEAQPATGVRGCMKRMMRFGPPAMDAVGCVALVAMLLLVVALRGRRRRSMQASPGYEALPTAEPFPPVVVIPMAKGGPPAAVQAAAPKAAAGKEGMEGAAPVLAA